MALVPPLRHWAELMINTLCLQQRKGPREDAVALVPPRRPWLSTHLPKLAFHSKIRTALFLLCFLSLAAELVLSHHKQLLFLIYTSGVGSWTNFIRAHDHHSLQD